MVRKQKARMEEEEEEGKEFRTLVSNQHNMGDAGEAEGELEMV